ncbi:hypothetical protein [Parabacteroides goldsteinii]|uniref:hypothetical protein n=1 Tax=Parabacteroides goldsteinii TaxID=328812 RepID=UPI0025A5FB8D|nr:hypothetical protein [Parabacteroides goldsteinii]
MNIRNESSPISPKRSGIREAARVKSVSYCCNSSKSVCMFRVEASRLCKVSSTVFRAISALLRFSKWKLVPNVRRIPIMVPTVHPVVFFHQSVSKNCFILW